MTLPAKLLRLVSQTVMDERLPWGVLMETGLVAIVKSGVVGPPIPATSVNTVEA